MTSKSQIRIEDDHHNPARREGEVAMASEQSKYLVELYASIKERLSKPDIDLATTRDIVENLHLAAIKPEAVTYAEADADGVPALWCIPEGCDANRVLLHSHSGGTVVTSMHTDRKAVGHIAKAVGVRALVLNYRRSPEHKFPAQIDDVEKAYHWLLAQRIHPENIDRPIDSGSCICSNHFVRSRMAPRFHGIQWQASYDQGALR